jgi:hypothetical protein
MSKSYTSSPPSASMACSGTAYFHLMITAFWDMAPCSFVEVIRRFRGAYVYIIMEMMDAECTCETSVSFNETTRHYIPELLCMNHRHDVFSCR